MQAGGDQIANREIPAVARVLVLQLGADVGDARLRLDDIDLAAADSIDAPLATGGCRPHIGGKQFEQLRLAGAVLADERPALAGVQLQVDVAQRPFLAAPHADGVQRDAQAGAHLRGTRQTPSCSTALPSRASLIRCASKVNLAQGWRSADTSS